MPAKGLTVRVRQQPGAAIIDLAGEIDGFAEESLNTAYLEAESATGGAILLNFTEVEYINSTGIALIVGLLTRAQNSQRRLLACGLSEHYREIFTITRLADFMAVFPDEASALAAVHHGAG